MARRLTLLLVLLGVALNVKSLWSGGVEWGTAVTDRAAGYWQPDGVTPTGKPFADVAVGGTLLTASLMSASWSIGPDDYISDLAPDTGTFSFKGTVAAVAGDDVVVSTGQGALWAGRVDTVQDQRDTKGNHWTTVNATNFIGALGTARLRKADGYRNTLDRVIELVARDAGVRIDVVDQSNGTYGLITLQRMAAWSTTFTGTVLDYANIAARSSNAMIASQPDGTIAVMTREAPLSWPPTAVSLTGASAPVTWTTFTTRDGEINRWDFSSPSGTDNSVTLNSDIYANGEQAFTIDNWLDAGDTPPWLALGVPFTDWWAYTPSVHTTYTGEFVVSDFSSTLLQLAPLDWVTESGTYSQVMSMQWNVDGPGQPMRLTITTDDFLGRL